MGQRVCEGLPPGGPSTRSQLHSALARMGGSRQSPRPVRICISAWRLPPALSRNLHPSHILPRLASVHRLVLDACSLARCRSVARVPRSKSLSGGAWRRSVALEAAWLEVVLCPSASFVRSLTMRSLLRRLERFDLTLLLDQLRAHATTHRQRPLRVSKRLGGGG